MFKMSGVAKNAIKSKRVKEDFDVSDVELTSDIGTTWNDPIEISQDIREFLVSKFRSGVEDFELEDIIDAIENGIRDFRKISNI